MPIAFAYARFMENRCNSSRRLAIHRRAASEESAPGNALIPARPSWKSKGSDSLVAPVRERELLQVLKVLLILQTDFFDQFRVHDEAFLDRNGPRLRVRLGIIHGDPDDEVS